MSPSGPTRNATSRPALMAAFPRRRHRGPGAGRRTQGRDAERRRFQRRHPGPREAGHRGRDTERRRFRWAGEGVGGTPTEGGENAGGETPKGRGRDAERRHFRHPVKASRGGGQRGGESGRWKRLLKSPVGGARRTPGRYGLNPRSDAVCSFPPSLRPASFPQLWKTVRKSVFHAGFMIQDPDQPRFLKNRNPLFFNFLCRFRQYRNGSDRRHFHSLLRCRSAALSSCFSAENAVSTAVFRSRCTVVDAGVSTRDRLWYGCRPSHPAPPPRRGENDHVRSRMEALTWAPVNRCVLRTVRRRFC